MKSLIATLLIAAATFGVTQTARAADDGTAGYTPVVCVTDGCTTDNPFKPRR